jgi:hypothetical protein
MVDDQRRRSTASLLRGGSKRAAAGRRNNPSDSRLGQLRARVRATTRLDFPAQPSLGRPSCSVPSPLVRPGRPASLLHHACGQSASSSLARCQSRCLSRDGPVRRPQAADPARARELTNRPSLRLRSRSAPEPSDALALAPAARATSTRRPVSTQSAASASRSHSTRLGGTSPAPDPIRDRATATIPSSRCRRLTIRARPSRPRRRRRPSLAGRRLPRLTLRRVDD